MGAAEDLATEIATNLAGYTLGTNVFHGPVRPPKDDVPAQAVFCLKQGDEDFPWPYKDASGLELQRPVVQVRIRSSHNDFAGGDTLAAQVYAAAHNQPPTGYIECRARESEANYLGRDEQGMHEWSINFRLWVES